MATRTYTAEKLAPGLVRIAWAAAAEGDDFQPLILNQAPADILFQVDGTPGGATLKIQGSCNTDAEGAGDYHDLLTAHGAAAELADANGIISLGSAPWWLKPAIVDGAAASRVVTATIRYIDQIAV